MNRKKDNMPDWEKLEAEYNRNYDPYDHKEIEGEEDEAMERKPLISYMVLAPNN